MAMSVVDIDCWHKNLTVLPRLSADGYDHFIEKHQVVKETTVRGYKFFLESYVHDVEGKFCEVSIQTAGVRV